MAADSDTRADNLRAVQELPTAVAVVSLVFATLCWIAPIQDGAILNAVFLAVAAVAAAVAVWGYLSAGRLPSEGSSEPGHDTH